jgi:hypothetical protein
MLEEKLSAQQTELKPETHSISPRNEREYLAYLHKEINILIHLTSEDINSWKNHMELKQSIEKKFDELIKNQFNPATKLLFQESKKWFIEGINKKDTDLIKHSLNLLIKIELNNLLK